MREWDPLWSIQFDETKRDIEPIFKEILIAFEHVGSTSIRGMIAKPMVDILIVVDDLYFNKKLLAEMEQRDYVLYRNYVAENSALFAKEIEGRRIGNIHVFPVGHREITKFLVKRDFFRTHPDALRRYRDLKYKLSRRYVDDYPSYREGKKDFLNKTIRKETESWLKTPASRPYWSLYDRVGIRNYII